jgi:hypothetical protein
LFLKQTEGAFEANLDMMGDTDNPFWRNVISHYNRYNLVQYHCQLCKQLIAILITTLSRGTNLAEYRMLLPWFLPNLRLALVRDTLCQRYAGSIPVEHGNLFQIGESI